MILRAPAGELSRWLERNTRTTITKTKSANDVAHRIWRRATAGWIVKRLNAGVTPTAIHACGPCHAANVTDTGKTGAEGRIRRCSDVDTPTNSKSRHAGADRDSSNGEERVRSHSNDGTNSQQSLHPTVAGDIVSGGG